MADQETGRRLAAVLAADVAGYSRLAGADEERTLARLRALRGDLIDPAVAAHRGRVVKRAGDGSIIEFRSVIDAVRSALEVQHGMVERNYGVAPERQILFRIGIHIGDVVGEADGDLMGDGVNIAARLEGICEPGGIVVSEDAYRQVRDRLDVSFADLGERELKNIARPTRVYAISPSPPRGGGEGRDEVGDARASPTTSPSLSATRRGEESPPRLSIVVLPFANIGGDPEQEYFVDGVTESLTTDLSRISGSFVIARNTAFTYKGKPVDVKQIGRELNVRYVLEGSVQRGGNRLRVNVQLIETASGKHLWAERFDKPVADLFDMQDEIVARLANQLNAELIAAEARRAETAPNPDSMDLYFQAVARINMGWLPKYVEEALKYCDRAVALDPGNVEALVYRGYINNIAGVGYLSDDPAARFAASIASATQAITIIPQHPFAHGVLGAAYIFSGKIVQGIAECERAISLDRNLAIIHATIGIGKSIAGRPDETEGHMVEALRLSPRDPTAFTWMAGAGIAKLVMAQDEEAVVWLRRAIETNRNLAATYFVLAAALALLDRLDEAQQSVHTGLELDPRFSIRRYLAATWNRDRERIIEGMRKAGVPEG